MSGGEDSGRYYGTWVVLPTYDEVENLPEISAAILASLPGARLLVVDDSSPDGTGELADKLAADEPRMQVLHRAGKEGLGKAYLAGFEVVMDEGAECIVQMDADGSHSPEALPTLVDGIQVGADLVIGSRYVRGGGVEGWGLHRRIISRGGSLFARTLLRLKPHDLTGGFKAWRRKTLEAIDWHSVHSGGYVFQIEMTYLASQTGARVIEVPIVFKDREVGQSKMSGNIITEALSVVLKLGWKQWRRP